MDITFKCVLHNAQLSSIIVANYLFNVAGYECLL